VSSGWFAWREDSLVLQIRVQPRAKTDAIEKIHDGRLKVKIKAPPVDRKANRALHVLLATQFGVTTQKVEIVRGSAGRDKTIAIDSPRVMPDWFLTLGGTAAS
jgi:hypothetical protein